MCIAAETAVVVWVAHQIDPLSRMPAIQQVGAVGDNPASFAPVVAVLHDAMSGDGERRRVGHDVQPVGHRSLQFDHQCQRIGGVDADAIGITRLAGVIRVRAAHIVQRAG